MMQTETSEKQWPDFVVDYRHDGVTYGINIRAEDWADAQRRLHSIGMSGEVIGKLEETIAFTRSSIHFVGIGAVIGLIVGLLLR